MVQSAITLRHEIFECTNFRGREGQNILRVIIFAGAPKNYVSRVLIFTESPKIRKIAKFYTCENLVSQGTSPGLNR